MGGTKVQPERLTPVPCTMHALRQRKAKIKIADQTDSDLHAKQRAAARGHPLPGPLPHA